MKFPIVANRKVWYSISTVLVVLSILGTALWGFNLSLHFTGGILVEYSFPGTVPSTSEIKDFTLAAQTEFNNGKADNEKIDIGNPTVIPAGEKNMDIRYRVPTNAAEQGKYLEFETALTKKVAEKYSADKESSQVISASVGQVLKERAIWATLLSVIAIVLYIVFAFRKLPKNYNPWVFGINTIGALLHDIIVLIGVFVFLGHFFHIEMGPYFITALLTILGYSVNDTIVVFDRVRENMARQKKGETIESITEDSIWQTMARSLHTSMTVLITLGALLILGPDALKSFIFALFIGVIIGTYSSIFLASPMLVTFKNYLLRK
ncbi:MAG: protein translocase subunit SecF [Candidatus Gracilibacteria bacterium]